ncbi:MAG: hypothetical protein WDO15_08750 [Bacteroidota bacterium]
MPIESRPDYARPNAELLNLLATLSAAPSTEVVIISGPKFQSIGEVVGVTCRCTWLPNMEHHSG